MELESALEVLQSLKNSEKCIFCRHNEIDELRYGKMYKFNDIITHYFCMLFSSDMEQNGDDQEGILGFLPEDINREVSRGNRLRCCYCHHAGATIGCFVKTCRKKFHYPCGIQHGSQHLFYGQFRSYCPAHRREQNVPESAINLTEKSICVMCHDVIDPKPLLNNVWAPCCKTAWLHRTCVQRMAINAGYFFKCPNCNNKELFRKEMSKCGIYIPDQDAVWELEPNAFHDLIERHSSCDAGNCICPEGRNYSEQSDDWEVILCSYCGSQGIHNKCWEILQDPSEQWVCALCAPVDETNSSVVSVEEPGPSELPEKQPQSPRRPQNLRKETSPSRSQRCNRRKRNLSPSSSEENESSSRKIRSNNQSSTLCLYGNSGEPIEVVRLQHREVPAVEMGGLRVDVTVVQIDSDDDENDSAGQSSINKLPNDDIERRLTALGVANKPGLSPGNRRIASDIAPSIIIDLLDDSDDENQNNEKSSLEPSENKIDDSENEEDDDVIFVGCDPPNPNANRGEHSSALIRIVSEDKVVITTPMDIRKNLETLTSTGNITVTTNSVNPARSSFHLLPCDRPNSEGNRNFVWHSVPLHKSQSNTYQQPQIISAISLHDRIASNNVSTAEEQPSVRDVGTEKNSNFYEQAQRPTILKENSESNSWISESTEIIYLD